MSESLFDSLQKVAESLVNNTGDIASTLNTSLNQYLSWPLKAGPARIKDSEGQIVECDAVIYSQSSKEKEDQPVDISSDAAACCFYISSKLDIDTLSEGYKHIASVKRLRKTEIKESGHPINNSILGVILSVTSEYSIEHVAELMMNINNKYPSSEWPDIVAVLTRGTVNYAVQFYGETITGDFMLPNIKSFPIMPMYVHVIARGLGIVAFNKLIDFIFKHLHTFSPGVTFVGEDEILADTFPLGITLGAYQFNMKRQLVLVSNEEYIKKGPLAPRPFRIEDDKGNTLSHLQFIQWQEGGAVRLVGKLPLEGILIFLGPIAKKAQIIKQDGSAISSVLPIQETNFIEMLKTFQRRSNMKIIPEELKGTLRPYADEGVSTPFFARTHLGLLKIRDIAFNGTPNNPFDEAFRFVIETLTSFRMSSKEIIEILKEHKAKVSNKEIASVSGGVINIKESIDKELQKAFAEYLNSSVRVVKDGMQKLLQTLGLDIGFMFQKEKKFQKNLGGLRISHPELADYLLEARKWTEPLISRRNSLHEGWMLTPIDYKQESGEITAIEPSVNGNSISEYVDFIFNRLCCFVEETTAYALQSNFPDGISITEVPISDRSKDSPVRFEPTFIEGGLHIWRIKYHENKFDEV
jgi:hypothetical protein